MQIDTYDNLKTALVDWSERADIPSGQLEQFIFLAENDASQQLRVPAMENKVELISSGGRLGIPFDFMELRRLTYTGGEVDTTLEYLPWDQFVAISNNDSTNTMYFSRQGAYWYLHASLADGATVDCYYYRFIPALSDTVPTNWLLQVSPQAYLYGSLKYLYEFVFQADRAAYWGDKLDKELNKLQAIADLSEHRGSSLAVRQIP